MCVYVSVCMCMRSCAGICKRAKHMFVRSETMGCVNGVL